MTGKRCIEIAAKHLGEKYVLGAFAPKNNPEWKGPWDCAEYCSWVIFQAGQVLYGVDNHQNPAEADAYSGFFLDDAGKFGVLISVEAAAAIPGALLVRKKTGSLIGHVAFADGGGGTYEARGAAYGVMRANIAGRRWDAGILVPGFHYDKAAGGEPLAVPGPKPGMLYCVGGTSLDPAKTKEIQKALAKQGIDPGPVDGIFGSKTAKAVHAFQLIKGLVADGEVGTETAKALKIKLP